MGTTWTQSKVHANDAKTVKSASGARSLIAISSTTVMGIQSMAGFVPMEPIMTQATLGSSRPLTTVPPARRKSSASLEESLMIATQATSVQQELTHQPLTTDPKLTRAPRATIAVRACQSHRFDLTACLLSSQASFRSKSANIASQGTTVSMAPSKQKCTRSETTAPSATKNRSNASLLCQKGFYCYDEGLANLTFHGMTYRCPESHFCPPGT
jgi:hypothetical protein